LLKLKGRKNIYDLFESDFQRTNVSEDLEGSFEEIGDVDP